MVDDRYNFIMNTINTSEFNQNAVVDQTISSKNVYSHQKFSRDEICFKNKYDLQDPNFAQMNKKFMPENSYMIENSQIS